MNRFMMGRYGMDELNRFMLHLSLALIVLGLFVHSGILRIITVVILILLYARSFSRSIHNRQRENMKYLEIKAKFFGRKSRNSGYSGNKYGSGAGFGGGARNKNDGKRVLICPICKDKLRVPVGAGRIKVKCPHCNSEFEEVV